MKLLEERPVTLVEVKELLEKRKKDAPKAKKMEEKIKDATPVPAPTTESPAGELKLPEEPKKEATGELSYEQQNTLDYADKFAKLSEKDANELAKKLGEAGGLTDKQIISIINILPKKEDELKAIVSKDKLDVSEDQIKAVVKIVKDYRK